MTTLDSVLQLSKLESGVHARDRKEAALSTVVHEVVNLLAPKADEKSLTMELSRPDQSVVGSWNEDAVYRICRNLVENAIKFTPEGGRVNVRMRTDGLEPLLEVEDTGIGIEPDAVDKLFHAFEQESEGLDREYEGSGLGLSIVERLTEQMGGTVEVETQKGEGSRFIVRLPLKNRGDVEGAKG